MALVKYQNWAVDEAGNIVASSAYEVRDTSGVLVSIYSDAGGTAASNPGTASTGGLIEFYAESGVYDITVGGGPSATTQRAIIGGPDVAYFSSRADAVAASDAEIDGRSLMFDGTVWYRYSSGATAISDLPDWLPLDDVYPDHWAENTTPGTTDMTSAIKSALEYGVTNLRETTYRISGTIAASLSVSGATFGLHGKGKYKSIIKADTGSFDWLTFENTVASIYGLEISGVTFYDRSGTDRPAGTVIKSLSRVIEGSINDCSFGNFYNGVALIAGGRFRMSDNDMLAGGGTFGRSTKGGYAVDLDGDGVGAGKTTDFHFYHNQIHDEGPDPNTSFLLACLRIQGADGIYIKDNHFYGADYHIRVEPDDSVDEQTIASLEVMGNYFDRAHISHMALFGVASTAYRNIHVSSNQFRESLGTGASVQVNLSSGYVEDISFLGNTFRQNNGRDIYIQANEARSASIRCNTFIDWNESSTGSIFSVDVTGENWQIFGNKFLRGDAAGGTIRLAATDGAVYCNDVSESTAGSLVSVSTSTIKRFDNVGLQTVSSGSATMLSGNSEVVVTHGLDVTPVASDILLTHGSALVSGSTRIGVKSGSITSTQFTIESNAAVSGDATILWRADASRR